ncbi:hypothetical protein [Arsenophonus sp.]|uniref:hypothetical protein n=1 Tax=Arsenophonus sp. TaxID=1872640 RepID=UPI0038791DD7
MKKNTLILLITACFASKAIALECGVIINNSNDLNYEEKESVGEILIPNDAKIGEIIWKSNPIRKNIRCNSSVSENVYFYPFPKRKKDPTITLPEGMTFGITYKNKDIDLNQGGDNNSKDTGITVNANTVDASIEFQLYIKKTGDIKTDGSDLTLPIVQLDGVGGINATGGRNYRYSLSSLNNISDVECSFKYQRKPFNININNDLTIKQQKILIGNYLATCSPENKMTGRTIVYSIPEKSEEFSTDLEGLNYHLDVNNSIKINDKGKSTIDVHALFKLDYKDQDWLYDTNTKITMPNVTIIPKLQRIN